MTLRVTGLAPLIQVYDMPEAIRFYCDDLGFEQVSNWVRSKRPKAATSTGRGCVSVART